MPELTHEVLVTPAPGTIIAPIHEYTEEQKTLLKQIREARTTFH